MSRNRTHIRYILLVPLFLIGINIACSVSDLGETVPIEPWVETSCGEEAQQHYSSLLPDFSRSFEIASSPTARNMSLSSLDIEEAVSQAKALGDYLHIILQVSFEDPSSNISDYVRFVSFADRADMRVSLALDLRNLPDGATFSNQLIRQAYLSLIETLVFERVPDLINLCMEMNQYALDEDTSADYPNLKSLYIEAYDLVESMSPSTITYMSHSWELDLFQLDETPLQLIVDLEHKMDMVGLSSFPQLIGIVEPAEIPGIYFSDITSWTSLPIIMECGFTDSPDFNSSESIARDFPPHLMRALDDINVAFIQLVAMHDAPLEGLDPFFHNMGLRKIDGGAKPIYCGWQYIADS